ncbi:LysR substrate-binding domain-containing protein [Acetobacter orleanensis]|uniref:DNA-binding transcriptional activator GcvA n=1 Tax=Acetobacter orleanensis TaxID=104099 RepID=A0A4Y3TJU5_9PROT|nr:LysR substrate-binding domain-containing protein [Acetobacter orleanensis]KXV62677.1 hypothetical protein AD949_09390 [Acetobacter orleanensis]PCD79190.1 hypothetical protein CO710_07890 [Acetobacter orleanensis]GAN68620.1 transcriptional regulator LysR [Acetobacter orleanensis JCM 7639]GBR27755.1 transcriptional regulator [Acetobacter orleanensis NRIC 0473]GEB83251.1 DNA-binding transcriptional activator GcvA [Acetobacter orleanensis]
MQRRLPPLHTLYAFESAVRHKSFSKAAEELLLTRSAVSHRIGLLEELTGFPLFHRHARSLVLTSAGEAYIPAVRRALAALEEVKLPLLTQTPETNVTISTPPSFARLVLWPEIQHFTQKHPEVQISIEFSSSGLDITAEEADIYIRFGTGNYPGMKSIMITKSDIFPAATLDFITSYNLSTAEDLARCTILRSPLEPWKPWFVAAGLSWPEPIDGPYFGDFSMMYQAAQEGRGVTLVRASLLARFDHSSQLVPITPIKAIPEYGYYIVYREEKVKNENVHLLLEWLQNVIHMA